MSWSRRRVLKAGGALAAVSAAALSASGLLVRPACAQGAGSRVAAKPRRIALANLHTAERLEIEFFKNGAYVPEALTAIEILLRDFRSGEKHPMDPQLMDYLVDVAATAGVDPVFSVISGYRSPQTNANLRDKSTGVAEHSLHMEGRAIDVRMSTVDCASLCAHAQDMQRGGVGYYRGSDFVHLDTGKFRTWKG
jgi:uncharacterized protein YcbK (DUF882 family)